MGLFGRDDDDDRRGENQPDYGSGEGRSQGGEGRYQQGGEGRYQPGGEGGYQQGGRSHGDNSGYRHDEDEDLRGAAETASRHAGDSGDSGFFGNILNSIGQKKGQLAQEDVDEDAAVRHHQKYFGGGQNDDEEATSGGIGGAAAVQALKMFSGGSSGGGGQSQFIGLAMSEASKLFDQQSSAGRVGGGANKESAVMQAGEMALKMYMKSQGGSSGTGGIGGLMGMASKFM